MFYIGSNVMDWPLEAQRAPADGKLKSLPIASESNTDGQDMKCAPVSKFSLCWLMGCLRSQIPGHTITVRIRITIIPILVQCASQ